MKGSDIDIGWPEETNSSSFKEEEKADPQMLPVLQMIKQNNLDGALKRLKEITGEHPDHLQAHYILSLVYYQKKMYTESLVEASRAVEIDSGFAGAYYQMASAYHQLNQLEKALEFYRKALEIEPENLDALFNAGLILFDFRNTDEALPYFMKADSLRPGDTVIMEMIARCHMAQREYKKALQWAQRAKTAAADSARQEQLDILIQLLRKVEK